tara:strand:+ start:1892 stop:2482 length:591 start_codon:yes stop_codon:yes gene_type:complete
MAPPTAFNIASKFIEKKESDSKHLNKRGWKIYNDFGKPAVGPGIRLSNLPKEYRKMKEGQRIPADVVRSAYNKQLASVDKSLVSEFGDVYSNLSPHKKASTMSLIYNVGMEGFKTGGKKGNITKAYTALKEGNVETFAEESFDPEKGFVKSNGIVLRGLQNRRIEERNLFATKEYTLESEDIAMASMLREERPMIQ